MELNRRYTKVRFSEAAILDAAAAFDETFGKPKGIASRTRGLHVKQGDDSWSFDEDDEFFAAYSDASEAVYRRRLLGDGPSAEMTVYYFGTVTRVVLHTEQDYLAGGRRNALMRVMRAFDDRAQDCAIPDDGDNRGPVVFIGHGQSSQWREMKDHLADKHGYQVTAYETGARAGHTIRDTLQSMLDDSAFAVLVFTQEDETADGSMRARQNVVHETGLFQGKLGFERAIMLIQEGTEDFSNIHGIHQIRFKTISETFGDVLATLRREFGERTS